MGQVSHWGTVLRRAIGSMWESHMWLRRHWVSLICVMCVDLRFRFLGNYPNFNQKLQFLPFFWKVPILLFDLMKHYDPALLFTNKLHYLDYLRQILNRKIIIGSTDFEIFNAVFQQLCFWVTIIFFNQRNCL